MDGALSIDQLLEDCKVAKVTDPSKLEKVKEDDVILYVYSGDLFGRFSFSFYAFQRSDINRFDTQTFNHNSYLRVFLNVGAEVKRSDSEHSFNPTKKTFPGVQVIPYNHLSAGQVYVIEGNSPTAQILKRTIQVE